MSRSIRTTRRRAAACAFRLVFSAHMGWIDREHGLLHGRLHAVRAIELDDCDPWGQTALGYLGDDGVAHRGVDRGVPPRAVELNPNSAKAHGDLGRGLAFAGQDREAIAQVEDAIRLSPLDPDMAMFLGAIAVCALWRMAVRGRSPACGRIKLRSRPGFQGAQRLRCASLAQTGRIDEARSFSRHDTSRATATPRSIDQGQACPIRPRN